MRNFTHIFLSALTLLVMSHSAYAQIVISKPNLGFSQACASPNFNTYNLNFTFSPITGISSSNQFVVELSDSEGSYDSSTIIYTSAAGEITASPATITFSMPIDVAAENYKLRIKSTSPVSTSANSNVFSAYYKAQDTPFSINNLISSAAFCSGGSYVLTIDNPGDENNDSPLQYPGLTFKWYKETSETTSVFVASGESLEVNEAGVYFCETDYGTCTSNSFSNRVSVSQAGSSTETDINSSKGNPFCPDEGTTTLTTISANSYQWFKDGSAISGANDQSYITDEPGEYTVNIDLGACNTSAKITLESEQFESSINVDDVNFMEDGEIISVEVTTDANNPTFEWYRNESIIPSATSHIYQADQNGNYKVVITQGSGCAATNEFAFRINNNDDVFPDVNLIPNVISPNGDNINDTWMIPLVYVSGTNTNVTIIDSNGKILLKTSDYQNNWPMDQLDFTVNPVVYYIIEPSDGDIKKGSITVIR